MADPEIKRDVLVKHENGVVLKETIFFSESLVGARIGDSVLDGHVLIQYGHIQKNRPQTVTINGTAEVPVDKVYVPVARAVFYSHPKVVQWRGYGGIDTRQVVTASNESTADIRSALFIAFSEVSTLLEDSLWRKPTAWQGDLTLYDWDGIENDVQWLLSHFDDYLFS